MKTCKETFFECFHEPLISFSFCERPAYLSYATCNVRSKSKKSLQSSHLQRQRHIILCVSHLYCGGTWGTYSYVCGPHPMWFLRDMRNLYVTQYRAFLKAIWCHWSLGVFSYAWVLAIIFEQKLYLGTFFIFESKKTCVFNIILSE